MQAGFAVEPQVHTLGEEASLVAPISFFPLIYIVGTLIHNHTYPDPVFARTLEGCFKISRTCDCGPELVKFIPVSPPLHFWHNCRCHP